MSFKMECYSKLIATQNGISLTMECHAKWNVPQNGMSIKVDSHSNIEMSPKLECHLN